MLEAQNKALIDRVYDHDEHALAYLSIDNTYVDNRVSTSTATLNRGGNSGTKHRDSDNCMSKHPKHHHCHRQGYQRRLALHLGYVEAITPSISCTSLTPTESPASVVAPGVAALRAPHSY